MHHDIAYSFFYTHSHISTDIGASCLTVPLLLLMDVGWKSRDEIFDMGRDATPLADVYSKFIEEQLTSLAVREETTSLAALIIEPGILLPIQLIFWIIK